MSKVLVTGGAGFIGSHVVEAYLAAGLDVVVVDNLSTGHKKNLSSNAKFYEADICAPEFGEIVAAENPSAINHHAAQVSVRNSVDDPGADATTNILGSINVLETARKQGVEKIVFASTGGAIYGEQDYFPADENHPCRPVSPYGIAKRSVEHYLRYYAGQYGMRTTVLRYANVYGPRQDPHGEAGVVAIFTERMIGGDQPVINGDGSQTRDFVYVGDVARANVAALQLEQSAVINIGTSIETSVNRLFDLIKELGGFTCEQRHGQAKPGEQARSVVDPALAERLLGWRPEVGLEEGLGLTVDYFRET